MASLYLLITLFEKNEGVFIKKKKQHSTELSPFLELAGSGNGKVVYTVHFVVMPSCGHGKLSSCKLDQGVSLTKLEW